jgi:hypothetical protein
MRDAGYRVKKTIYEKRNIFPRGDQDRGLLRLSHPLTEMTAI